MRKESMGSGYDPAIHHRRSIRLRGHDYAGGGVYFLTVCLADRRPLFGTVVNGRMALHDAGRAAAACWQAIPEHFPQVTLDEWVIMPDHVHGILRIARRGMACHAPAFGRPMAGSLGTIIGAYKVAVTRAVRGLGLACQTPPARQTPAIWQRNYYDIIVRDPRALENIRQYIRNNPAHWDTLRYGEPRFFAGNRELLDLPMTAFLASRRRTGMACHALPRACHAPARWPERPACVIGGFLSDMERDVFNACLSDGIPVVWILARGLARTMPHRVQQALDAGRLLALTPFDESIEGFSAARAAWCNQYALHLAHNAVIGHLAPDGMLACLLADLRRDIPVHYLDQGNM
ncbi:MAG: transposase [Kiritimatiellae bacterium]|nr:transposase [Kiritimatiellia bacterium]